MDLKQIIYIHNNRFSCQLVEKVCKQEGVGCYTLGQLEDYTYLVNDLRPEIIVMTQEALNLFGDDAVNYALASDHKSKLVLMTNNEQKDDRFNYYLGELLNPQNFLQDVINLLG